VSKTPTEATCDIWKIDLNVFALDGTGVVVLDGTVTVVFFASVVVVLLIFSLVVDTVTGDSVAVVSLELVCGVVDDGPGVLNET